MNTTKLLSGAVSILFMLASSDLSYAQGRRVIENNAPVRTGSAGNSNTGPGFDPPGGDDLFPQQPAGGIVEIESDAPVRTGSAGNSNTGPGFNPAGSDYTLRVPSRDTAGAVIESNSPVRTGSAGNSNTGPGFVPQ